MRNYLILFYLAIPMVYFGCKNHKATEEDEAYEESPPAEQWKSLSSLDYWHSYNKLAPGEGWRESDGVISLDRSAGDGGDLTSNEEYENFELSLEWKIDSCGNSGIMYNVFEAEEFRAPYFTGPEMQILDNPCHSDGNIDNHRAGDLYDLIACSEETVNPTGEWNDVVITSDLGKVTFRLNEVDVVQFQMFDDNWKEMIANSKFKQWPQFGTFKKGKIVLQDHGDKVWFRNIKIKEL